MALDSDQAGPYSIGSDTWPGLSKLIEECGEVIQVAGKIIGTGGEPKHWDGSDLRDRLIEEVADLTAAIEFVTQACVFDWDEINDRAGAKRLLFERWHREQRGLPDPGRFEIPAEVSP